MDYHAPVDNMMFILKSVLAADDVLSEDTGYDYETANAMLLEAAKIAENVMAPLRRAMDMEPAHLENGVVRLPKGVDDAFKAVAEAGFCGMNGAEEFGGLQMPTALVSVINEILGSANLALSLNPLLTQGQIEALEAHASDALKAIVLPKLISGEWTGTMNLTEPQAGSDLAALKSTATPLDNGRYAVSGQKIFISWGDHELAENVSHLVLARLPDAPAGSRGISLFLVPKYKFDEDGALGERNTARAISLEHKMGIHGSPTAVMEFDNAEGYLVGAPHGGLAAMFTMMNNARLGVGIQGVCQAEAAYQAALAYAKDRVQGKPLQNETGAIVDHADVKRMLIAMKTQTLMARAIAYDCALSIDRGKMSEAAKIRAGVLTPIAKAYGTDIGCEVAHEAAQVIGGMGFIEETGVAQYYRDVRVTAIYEGTNGIQAMDLVGRKFMDKGEGALALITPMREVAALSNAAEALRNATHSLLSMEPNARFACSVPYLRSFAEILGAYYLHIAAEADAQYKPYARFAQTQIVPLAVARLQILADLPDSVTDVAAEAL